MLKSCFKGFKKGMKEFGDAVAIIVNSILLTFVYVLGVGLSSLMATLAGKQKIATKISKKRVSYWTDLDLKKKSLEEYYRQF